MRSKIFIMVFSLFVGATAVLLPVHIASKNVVGWISAIVAIVCGTVVIVMEMIG